MIGVWLGVGFVREGTERIPQQALDKGILRRWATVPKRHGARADYKGSAIFPANAPYLAMADRSNKNPI